MADEWPSSRGSATGPAQHEPNWRRGANRVTVRSVLSRPHAWFRTPAAARAQFAPATRYQAAWRDAPAIDVQPRGRVRIVDRRRCDVDQPWGSWGVPRFDRATEGANPEQFD